MKRWFVMFFLLMNFFLEGCFEHENNDTKLTYKNIPQTSLTKPIEQNLQNNLEPFPTEGYKEELKQNNDPRKILLSFLTLMKQCKIKDASKYMLVWEKYYQKLQEKASASPKPLEQDCLEKLDNEDVKFIINDFEITWDNNEWVLVDVLFLKQEKQIKMSVPMVKLNNQRYITQDLPEYQEIALSWSVLTWN